MKFTITTICLNAYNPTFDRWEWYTFVFESVANSRTRFWQIIETKGAGHGIAKRIRNEHAGWHRLPSQESLREFLFEKFRHALKETMDTSWETLPRAERNARLQKRAPISPTEEEVRQMPYLRWISIKTISRRTNRAA